MKKYPKNYLPKVMSLKELRKAHRVIKKELREFREQDRRDDLKMREAFKRMYR